MEYLTNIQNKETASPKGETVETVVLRPCILQFSLFP